MSPANKRATQRVMDEAAISMWLCRGLDFYHVNDNDSAREYRAVDETHTYCISMCLMISRFQVEAHAHGVIAQKCGLSCASRAVALAGCLLICRCVTSSWLGISLSRVNTGTLPSPPTVPLLLQSSGKTAGKKYWDVASSPVNKLGVVMYIALRKYL